MQSSNGNFVVPWSDKKFGPDGPWQAVSVRVGGNDSQLGLEVQHTENIALYPGHKWRTVTISDLLCERLDDDTCTQTGTWDPDPEEFMNNIISFEEDYINEAAGIELSPVKTRALGLTIGPKTVWNTTLGTAEGGGIKYPNGAIGAPIGFLSLGATNGDSRQFFAFGPERGNGINASIFPGQLYEEGQITSYTYGLHIGSAAFDYPGSLVFGGFNKGRVIGPVTTFSNSETIPLLDIGIGVEFGDSPFEFKAKDRLLSSGPMDAFPDPVAPYISLPRKTCDAITDLLPVTFDDDLKYYLWNTDDPQYFRIVSSPAYLSFTFPPTPGGSNNIIIKVPFALLNLTLDEPITSSPTPYFPCVPYNSKTPVLGRAFLQAAFIGKNWITNTSWLAQAPGPGIARDGLREQNMDIPKGATLIEGYEGENLFNENWANHWSILSSLEANGTADGTTPGTPPEKTSSTESSGLSTGAKAGIAVGGAVAAVAIVGVLIFFLRRRSLLRQQEQTQRQQEMDAFATHQQPPLNYEQIQPHKGLGVNYGQYDEWIGKTPREMPATGHYSPVEIADTSKSAWNLYGRNSGGPKTDAQ